MNSFISVVFGGIALVSAASAQAVTYDAFTSFDATTSTSGGFTYGSYSGGVFTAYTPGGSCLLASTTCLTSGNYLGAYKTSDGLAHDSGTVNVPSDALFLHPGANGEISFVLFTAPTSGIYNLAISLFDADDDTRHSVRVFAYLIGQLVDSGLVVNLDPISGAGPVYLTAGDVIGYGVEYNTSYFYDSTGINFTLSTVPEPATWALMIGGFAMTGAAMRRRRTPHAA